MMPAELCAAGSTMILSSARPFITPTSPFSHDDDGSSQRGEELHPSCYGSTCPVDHNSELFAGFEMWAQVQIVVNEHRGDLSSAHDHYMTLLLQRGSVTRS